jgi:hypothetical protein
MGNPTGVENAAADLRRTVKNGYACLTQSPPPFELPCKSNMPRSICKVVPAQCSSPVTDGCPLPSVLAPSGACGRPTAPQIAPLRGRCKRPACSGQALNGIRLAPDAGTRAYRPRKRRGYGGLDPHQGRVARPERRASAARGRLRRSLTRSSLRRGWRSWRGRGRGKTALAAGRLRAQDSQPTKTDASGDACGAGAGSHTAPLRHEAEPQAFGQGPSKLNACVGSSFSTTK